MNRHLEGKVCIVTGGTGALGSAVAAALVREGARVHVTYRSDEDAAQVPAGAAGHKIDLTDPAQVARLFDETMAADGRVDVLANVAGGWAGGPIAKCSDETLEKMLTINLRTCFFCCRKAAAVMSKGGRIINVSAASAVKGSPNNAAYAASKGAVLSLTMSLSKELAAAGITVNAVLPTTIDTPANRKAMPEADFNKWTSPEAIAEVFVFLASDAASAVTGAAIQV